MSFLTHDLRHAFRALARNPGFTAAAAATLALDIGATTLGTAIGAAAALSFARLLEPLLYGIAPTDPVTLASVAVLLVAATASACYVPARRAGRLDPVTVLRSE